MASVPHYDSNGEEAEIPQRAAGADAAGPKVRIDAPPVQPVILTPFDGAAFSGNPDKNDMLVSVNEPGHIFYTVL